MSEELDELIEMARTIRMTPEQGNPTSRKARDMGHSRRSFAYGNVKMENDSITWEMVDRAGERLEESSAGDLLFVRSGGFAVPESSSVAYGTTEVVPFPRILTGEGARATRANADSRPGESNARSLDFARDDRCKDASCAVLESFFWRLRRD